MGTVDDDIRQLAASGNKIEAIKLYRERYGVGLKEAKDVVDALHPSSRLVPGTATWVPPVERSDDPLSDDFALREAVEAELRAGRKINAIKLYHDRYPGDLREARDAIERYGARVSPPAVVGSTLILHDDAEVREAVEAELRAGRKINAIKALRDRYAFIGLKEAKDMVDAWVVEQGIEVPSARPCFVATAAFEGVAAPEVIILRRFRDHVLAANPAGRFLCRTYHHLSPPLAHFVAREPNRRALARRLLRPAVRLCERALSRRQRGAA